MISSLSSSIESKLISGSERNLTSTQWIEYHNETKRKTYNTLPTSNITAEAVSADGFTLRQTDNAGVTSTAGCAYTASGMTITRTDARGNSTTTVTDTAGRTLSVTDAAGNTPTTRRTTCPPQSTARCTRMISTTSVIRETATKSENNNNAYLQWRLHLHHYANGADLDVKDY